MEQVLLLTSGGPYASPGSRICRTCLLEFSIAAVASASACRICCPETEFAKVPCSCTVERAPLLFQSHAIHKAELCGNCSVTGTALVAITPEDPRP
ncbi:hypothetical protein LZ32DRAFT_39091 [Colletotrichum eremochloae]|nr:hypothetical protein LZ32DRAFT_39091 [Colletotrichum eremochloae]